MTQVCRKCILPAGSAGIVLDETGVCNHCRNYRPIVHKGEEALTRLLSLVRDDSKKYNCMVNVSGGRDSSYALLSLVKDYRMKVLAVNYANPFTDPQAKKNLENVIRILGVDFIQFKLKNNIHERILKNNIRAWFKNPTPAMVPSICIGCKIIWPTMLNIARRNKIRCIVNGGNPFEYTSFKKDLLGVSHGASLKSTYLANVKGLAKEAIKNLSYLKPEFLPMVIKGYLFGNPYAPGSRLLDGNITYVDYFHYVPWEEKKVLKRIQQELEWDFPHHLHSTWRFDCQIAHLKDHIYLKTLGITEKDDFYSKMVREGQISRQEALERTKRENALPMDILRNLFDQLEIRDFSPEKETSFRQN